MSSSLPRPTADPALLAVASSGTTSKQEARRRKAMAAVPSWYRAWLHLAFNLASSLMLLVFAALHVRHFEPRSWATVLAIPVVANAFEWASHRWLMHRSWPGARAIYQRHALLHHTFFLHDGMAVRSFRELRFVLVHPLDLVGLLVAVSGLAGAWALLTSTSEGWLAVSILVAYIMAYEGSHTLYHLPGGSRGITWLRRHHALHHRQTLMSRWNFNVTVPLFDWLLGTMARDVPAPQQGRD